MEDKKEKNKQKIDEIGGKVIDIDSKKESAPQTMPKQDEIRLDEFTRLRLENIQMKINLHQEKINNLYKELQVLLNMISTTHKINIKNYEINFETGTLFSKRVPGVERGI